MTAQRIGLSISHTTLTGYSINLKKRLFGLKFRKNYV